MESLPLIALEDKRSEATRDVPVGSRELLAMRLCEPATMVMVAVVDVVVVLVVPGVM
jgi:hypothetical protein